MMISKFNVKFLEDAAEFRDNLDEKVRDKVKSDKTPLGEIEKAEHLRKIYLKQKIKDNEK